MGRKKNTNNETAVKEKDVKQAKPKAIGPFDIIKMIFTDNVAFNALSKNVLTRNYFMVNRVFAIKFPLQAQMFNKLSSSPADVVKAWACFAPKALGYGAVPSFVYTRTNKTEQPVTDTFTVDKADKALYCAHYNISLKDFDDMCIFAPLGLEQHFKNFIDAITHKDYISKT